MIFLLLFMNLVMHINYKNHNTILLFIFPLRHFYENFVLFSLKKFLKIFLKNENIKSMIFHILKKMHEHCLFQEKFLTWRKKYMQILKHEKFKLRMILENVFEKNFLHYLIF